MSNVSNAKYDPQIHFNHRKPWSIQDQKYLIKFHKDKYADLSLSLGRTYKTIAGRIYNLRKSGEING